jgi:hypothetical protein
MADIASSSKILQLLAKICTQREAYRSYERHFGRAFKYANTPTINHQRPIPLKRIDLFEVAQ